MRIFFVSLAVLLLGACGNNAQQPAKSATEGPQNQADSLLQEVIDGHDVAMPKIKKLERLIVESQAALDSINKLPADRRKENDSLKQQLETVHTGLVDANKKMTDWMNGFKYDTLKDNEAARIQYLKDQKASVTVMKDAVLNSIEKADSVLTRK